MLDGVVLVLSAVEGVQAQTRVLMRTLRRLRLPTLLFVNKIDRRGADPERVLADIAPKLTPSSVRMGSVRESGRREAAFVPFDATDPPFLARLAERLADYDDLAPSSKSSAARTGSGSPTSASSREPCMCAIDCASRPTMQSQSGVPAGGRSPH